MSAMRFYHVAITAAADYLARRADHRAQHLERIVGLRTQGAVIAGGPAPDGKTADLFYRAPDLDVVTRLVEEGDRLSQHDRYGHEDDQVPRLVGRQQLHVMRHVHRARPLANLPRTLGHSTPNLFDVGQSPVRRIGGFPATAPSCPGMTRKMVAAE